MKDPIERQAAIDALNVCVTIGRGNGKSVAFKIVNDYADIVRKRIETLPSAQLDANEYRKRGEWEMFELITSLWYGKQCYFEEDNGMAYSRISHKTMTVHDAILEFIREIGDE